MYISSVLQSNRNSIEFSLLTWTRSGSKVSQSKFLQKEYGRHEAFQVKNFVTNFIQTITPEILD